MSYRRSEENDRIVCELYGHGLTMQEVADRVGCSLVTASNTLHDAGIRPGKMAGPQKRSRRVRERRSARLDPSAERHGIARKMATLAPVSAIPVHREESRPEPKSDPLSAEFIAAAHARAKAEWRREIAAALAERGQSLPYRGGWP